MKKVRSRFVYTVNDDGFDSVVFIDLTLWHVIDMLQLDWNNSGAPASGI